MKFSCSCAGCAHVQCVHTETQSHACLVRRDHESNRVVSGRVCTHITLACTCTRTLTSNAEAIIHNGPKAPVGNRVTDESGRRQDVVIDARVRGVVEELCVVGQ
jgi:hypothetical protein